MTPITFLLAEDHLITLDEKLNAKNAPTFESVRHGLRDLLRLR